MNPETRDSRRQYQVELELLEREAGAPLVPGELESWCTGIQDRIQSLLTPWRIHHHDLTRRISEITSRDPALLARARALEEKRTALYTELGEHLELLQAFLAEVREEPADSEEPRRRPEKIREDLLSWIVQTRALGREVEGWLLESIYRDRGDGD